jgi:hypothetical protein
VLPRLGDSSAHHTTSMPDGLARYVLGRIRYVTRSAMSESALLPLLRKVLYD